MKKKKFSKKNINPKDIRHKNARGFSILEVILALFVLAIGILGSVTLISNSMIESSKARDMVSASQIAQEGIELVKWVRDNNVVAGKTGDLIFTSFPGIADGTKCVIDFGKNPASPISCNIIDSSNNYKLYYSEINGLRGYNHTTTGPQTKFSRKIYIDPPSSPDEERLIRSFVFWGSNWTGSVPEDDGSDCLAINSCVYAESVLTGQGN